MKRTTLFIIASLAIAIGATAQTIIQVTTVEGINMQIEIFGEEAMVYNNNTPAIDESTAGKVTVPATVVYNDKTYPVTTIGYCAFEGCSEITEVVAPSCTGISYWAFHLCSKLTSVNIPKCTSIGKYAFYGCSSLAVVNFPLCTSIGDEAFKDCSSLTNISLPLCKSIGDEAFFGCYFTNISLPACTYIGNNAFNGCSSLTNISLPLCKSIGDEAFNGCSSLSDISLPLCTSIGNNAFKDCSYLTDISLPACTSIGNVFDGCSELTNISLPACTSIGNFTFYGCAKLETIEIPSCISIGNYAFQYCSELEAIELSSCKSIGDHAFESCTSLASIDLSGVETIGTFAFYNTLLESINLSVCTSLGSYAFWSCPELQSVVSTNPTPANLKILGAPVFDTEAPATLQILANLANVYEAAGWDASTFPKGGIQLMGDMLVSEGEIFAITTVEGVEMHFQIIDAEAQTARVCMNNEDPTVPAATAGTITVPASISISGKDYTVVEIGDLAFYDCSQLTRVNLPQTIQLISNWAFGNCTALVSIDLTGCESIYNYAFGGCTALSTVTGIGNAGYIESGAFLNCTSLATIFLDDANVAQATSNIFKNIGTLCTVYIPRGQKAALDAKGWNESIFKGGIVEIGSAKGDVNNDGSVDAQDASLIQQKVAGKISW